MIFTDHMNMPAAIGMLTRLALYVALLTACPACLLSKSVVHIGWQLREGLAAAVKPCRLRLSSWTVGHGYFLMNKGDVSERHYSVSGGVLRPFDPSQACGEPSGKSRRSTSQRGSDCFSEYETMSFFAIPAST
ncbi:hypothetical protein P3342_003598 [Pyrenophora teres f. teres]|nr:hypothetical protein P3342_003598 [Pyrenophora teres f. teres]